MSDLLPLISIVVLNYNGFRYLKRIIPSFFAQKHPRVEVIVSDNGSSDESLSFLKRNPTIILLENGSNIGYNQGKNRGIAAAKGKYILLLDEDIEIPETGFLTSILAYYQNLKLRGERIGFLSPVMIDEGSSSTKYYGIYYSFFGKKINRPVPLQKIVNYSDEIQIGAFHGGSVFFEKTVWNELGGFDRDFKFGLDDYDLGARAYLLGYSNFLFKQPLIHLGKAKDQNKRHFAWKYENYYEGLVAMAYKNFHTLHLAIFLVLFPFYALVLNTLLIVTKRNVYLLFSPVRGSIRIFSSLKFLRKKRSLLQKKRTVASDSFMRIRAPHFH